MLLSEVRFLEKGGILPIRSGGEGVAALLPRETHWRTCRRILLARRRFSHSGGAAAVGLWEETGERCCGSWGRNWLEGHFSGQGQYVGV
jgi:hypothetical protein